MSSVYQPSTAYMCARQANTQVTIQPQYQSFLFTVTHAQRTGVVIWSALSNILCRVRIRCVVKTLISMEIAFVSEC